MGAIMKATESRIKAWKWAAVAVVAALLVLSPAVAPTPAPPEPTAFIVQAASAELAAAAVESVGGEVTHRLEIIAAVGARLAAGQLAQLRTRGGVRIYADRTARAAETTDDLTEGGVTGSHGEMIQIEKKDWTPSIPPSSMPTSSTRLGSTGRA